LSTASKGLLDSALEKMALAVASEHVGGGSIIGLGSGSTVARFATALGKRNKVEHLGITIVPSSMQAWILAKENGLELYQDSAHCPEKIDVAVDGADQISKSSRAMVKGGGGALFKEKIILSSAAEAYILADEGKYVDLLNRSIPVEVSQFAVSSAEYKLRSELGANPLMRKLDKGYPFFTESGNVILDCQFPKPISDPVSLERSIKLIPGVIEAGVFNCRVTRFYKAGLDGEFGHF